MARPWRKGSAWPYVAKSGRRSYAVGFYDHDKTERSRSFPTVRHARAWMDDYVTAERRGRESLRRFLLDLDAKEANLVEARTIAEVLELYLAINAHPRNEGGPLVKDGPRTADIAPTRAIGRIQAGGEYAALSKQEYEAVLAALGDMPTVMHR